MMEEKEQETSQETGKPAGTQEQEKKRKTRSDKGRILLTPRDIRGLEWAAEQYAIRIDQLQRLLGVLTGQETKEAGLVTVQVAERVVERWTKLGFAGRRKLFWGEPAWVWVTRAGLKQLNLDYRYWEPNVTTLKHVYAVNQVRLWIERRRGSEAVWRSERTLKGENDRKGSQEEKLKHLVDAEVDLECKTSAVEVELTPKKFETTAEIVRTLADNYPSIWYFTVPTTRPNIDKSIKALPDAKRPRFRVFDFDDAYEPITPKPTPPTEPAAG